MSHMSIIQVTDDGKDHKSSDILDHHRFVGHTADEELTWDGQAGVAVLDARKNGEADEDSFAAAEVERGVSAPVRLSGRPGLCKNRGHEGLDTRIHRCDISSIDIQEIDARRAKRAK